MIDKLGRNIFISVEDGSRISSPPDMNQVMDKINELVDFANQLSYNKVVESCGDKIDIDGLVEQLAGRMNSELLKKASWYPDVK